VRTSLTQATAVVLSFLVYGFEFYVELSSALTFVFSEFIFHISDFMSSCFFFQGKRGIEKQPFQLPDFIAATGIEKIRQVN
jgi:hypothetical protein